MHPREAERQIKLCEECDHVVNAYRNEVNNPAIHAAVNPWKAAEFVEDLEQNRPERSVEWVQHRHLRWDAENNLLRLLKFRRHLSLSQPDSSDSSSVAESELGLLEEQKNCDLGDYLAESEMMGSNQEEQRKSSFKGRWMRLKNMFRRRGEGRKRNVKQGWGKQYGGSSGDELESADGRMLREDCHLRKDGVSHAVGVYAY